MAKKISELDELPLVEGNEYIPVAKNGFNFKLTIAFLKSMVTKNDIGLDQVDNVSDINKPISHLTAQALLGKAAVDHQHDLNEVIGLLEALDGKAPSIHSHTVESINGLVGILNDLAPALHAHGITDINGLNGVLNSLQEQLNFKAGSAHSHNASEITGFNAAVLQVINQPDVIEQDVKVGLSEW